MISNLLLIIPMGYEDDVQGILSGAHIRDPFLWGEYGWALEAEEVTYHRFSDLLDYLHDQNLPYQYRSESSVGTKNQVYYFSPEGAEITREWDEYDESLDVAYLSKLVDDPDNLVSVIKKRAELISDLDLTHQMAYRKIYKTSQLLQV